MVAHAGRSCATWKNELMLVRGAGHPPSCRHFGRGICWSEHHRVGRVFRKGQVVPVTDAFRPLQHPMDEPSRDPGIRIVDEVVHVMADTFTRSERSRIMAAVKSKDTTPELLVRRLVHSLGYRYRLHVRSLPGTPDLVFPRLRKIINVNGCFWHMHGCARCRVPSSRRDYWIAKMQRNAARDKRTQRELRQAAGG